MLFDILDTGLGDGFIALGIAHIAGLQIIVVSLEFDIRDMPGIDKDYLYLITMLTYGGLLGRYREPVQITRSETSAITLHRHFVVVLMQQIYKSLIDLERRFATCQDDKRSEGSCVSLPASVLQQIGRSRAESLNLCHDILVTHLAIGFKLRIAKRAPQVATRKTDEDSSTTRVASLTL